nr:hypothetical protein [uncultured Marinifilum sp.]
MKNLDSKLFEKQKLTDMNKVRGGQITHESQRTYVTTNTDTWHRAEDHKGDRTWIEEH